MGKPRAKMMTELPQRLFFNEKSHLDFQFSKLLYFFRIKESEIQSGAVKIPPRQIYDLPLRQEAGGRGFEAATEIW